MKTAEMNVTANMKRRKKSLFVETVQRLFQSPTAAIGAVILLLFIVIALAAPWITPYHYMDMDYNAIKAAPSSAHIFGTDNLGRDVFSRILYGARYSLGIGFSCAALSLCIGIVFGSVAGFFGGWVETAILRFCDIIQAVPGMILAIIISTVLGNGYFNTILAIVSGGMCNNIRMMRAQVLSVRKEEYIEAAQSINCSSVRIMFCHTLPNVISPMIVGSSMALGNTIMMASSLSFIGLGVTAPLPEWGAMLSAGREFFNSCPHLLIFPGLAILIVVLCFNMVGDGLRDALDPKLKR